MTIGWQLIETAPRDGTNIDLWALGERVADCTWNSHRKRWEHWWQGDFDGMGMVCVDGHATHWMPIPDAPLQDKP